MRCLIKQTESHIIITFFLWFFLFHKQNPTNSKASFLENIKLIHNKERSLQKNTFFSSAAGAAAAAPPAGAAAATGAAAPPPEPTFKMRSSKFFFSANFAKRLGQ